MLGKSVHLGTFAAALMVLGACEPDPGQYLSIAEREYGVSRTYYGSDLRIYHAALLDPNGTGLHDPGFLVGVENLHPESVEFAPANDPNRRAGERHVLTHIVRYDLGAPDGTGTGGPGARSCVLFTLLDRPEPDPARHMFDRCPGTAPFRPSAGTTASASQGEAINRLRNGIADALRGAPPGRPYSHILLMVMGWNTDQTWALGNFNSLAGNLADAAREHGATFRPLVIGVSWPSQWRLGEWSIVPDVMVRGLSFPFKRRDGSDTGAHVLRDLILAGVLGARGESGPPVVMIGHSFGALALVRALSTGRAAKKVVNDRGERSGFDKSDRLLLLQGAFEMRALYQIHGYGPLAPAFAQSRPRVTLTASRYDSAVASVIWGQYAGDMDTYDKACRGAKGWGLRLSPMPPNLAPIGCGVVEESPSLKAGLAVCTPTPADKAPPVRGLDGHPIRYFDASRMINCAQPFTGGGSHSDIFRRETAEFLWREMQ